MNPFKITPNTNTNTDTHTLHTILTKISKRSDTHKHNNLNMLYTNIQTYKNPSSIPKIIKTVRPCLTHANKSIRLVAFNILYIIVDIENSDEKIICDLILFCLKHLNSVNKKCRKKILNIDNLILYRQKIVSNVDYADDRVLFYKIIILYMDLIEKCNDVSVGKWILEIINEYVEMEIEEDIKFIVTVFDKYVHDLNINKEFKDKNEIKEEKLFKENKDRCNKDVEKIHQDFNKDLKNVPEYDCNLNGKEEEVNTSQYSKISKKNSEVIKINSFEIGNHESFNKRIEDLRIEDLRIEDLRKEDLRKEDLRKEDLSIEDLSIEDLSIEDLSIEDLNIEDNNKYLKKAEQKYKNKFPTDINEKNMLNTNKEPNVENKTTYKKINNKIENSNLVINTDIRDELKKILVSKVLKISKPQLINSKWNILTKYTDYIDYVKEDEIQRDAPYLQSENIDKILDVSNLCFDNIKVADKESLLVILTKVIDKTNYLCNYINAAHYQSKNLEFNILNYVHDFKVINAKCDYDKVNSILQYIENNGLWAYFDKSKTLFELNERNTIIRAYIIKTKIMIDIKPEEVNEIFDISLDVLPESYFRNNFINFKDRQEEIVRKIPNLLTSSYLDKIINNRTKLSKIIDLVTNKAMIQKILTHCKEKYTTNDYLFMLKNSIRIPEFLKHEIYYKLYRQPKMLYLYDYHQFQEININSKLIFTDYLNIDFINHLLECKKLDINMFLDEAITKISAIDVINSTFYSSQFFYNHHRFYENIEVAPFDTETFHYIKKLILLFEGIYIKSEYDNTVLCLIHVLNEMIGKSVNNMDRIVFDDNLIFRVRDCQQCFIFKILYDYMNLGYVSLDRIDQLEFMLGIDESGSYIKSDVSLYPHTGICRKIWLNEGLTVMEEDFITKISNKRVVNLLVEKYVQYLELMFGVADENQDNINENKLPDNTKDELSISNKYEYKNRTRLPENKERDLCNNIDKYILVISYTSHLNNNALKNLLKSDVGDDYQHYMMIIEKDFIWRNPNETFDGREDCFNQFLDKTYKILSHEFCNTYNFARFEENVIEYELFNLITSNIGFLEKVKTESAAFIWNIFIHSISHIRNINIVFFIEKMIQSLNYKDFLTECKDPNLIKAFAYNFPNLLTIPVSIDNYIEKEMNNKVFDIKATLTKRYPHYIVKILYDFEDTHFECTINMKNDDVSVTSFTCNRFTRDMLTMKMTSLLKKSRRFMEIISLWKVNIDRKMNGIKECNICYLVVDDANNGFPDFGCDWCGNKYHARCIVQWGKKSGKMTCPLCRKVIT